MYAIRSYYVRISSRVETHRCVRERISSYVFRTIVLSLVVLICCSACKEVGGDKLYALHLGQAPTAADWQRALPRLVTVRGGQPHKEDRLGSIDDDTVHTTTASCHHGASLPDPVEVDLRAFYTRNNFV